MNPDKADELRAEIEKTIQSLKQLADELEAKIAAHSEELGKAVHHKEVAEEFLRLEFGGTEPDGSRQLFDMPKRFAEMTIRDACRQILRERGPLHVIEMIRHMDKIMNVPTQYFYSLVANIVGK